MILHLSVCLQGGLPTGGGLYVVAVHPGCLHRGGGGLEQTPGTKSGRYAS